MSYTYSKCADCASNRTCPHLLQTLSAKLQKMCLHRLPRDATKFLLQWCNDQLGRLPHLVLGRRCFPLPTKLEALTIHRCHTSWIMSLLALLVSNSSVAYVKHWLKVACHGEGILLTSWMQRRWLGNSKCKLAPCVHHSCCCCLVTLRVAEHHHCMIRWYSLRLMVPSTGILRGIAIVAKGQFVNSWLILPLKLFEVKGLAGVCPFDDLKLLMMIRCCRTLWLYYRMSDIVFSPIVLLWKLVKVFRLLRLLL